MAQLYSKNPLGEYRYSADLYECFPGNQFLFHYYISIKYKDEMPLQESSNVTYLIETLFHYKGLCIIIFTRKQFIF